MGMKKILIIIVAIISLMGCSSEWSKSTEILQSIVPENRLFNIKDLEAIGFKKNREYNVDGLEGVLESWNGFWAPDRKDMLQQKEYELRFYLSHSNAVNLGEALAQEVTGKNAKLKKSEVTWKEGVKDRRQIIGREGGSRNSTGPKHGNYAIFGNLIMLCEGPEGISLEVCWKLITALKNLDK